MSTSFERFLDRRNGEVPDWTSAATLITALQDLSRSHTIEEVQQVVKRAARDLGSADGAAFVLRERGFCFYADEDAIGPLWKGQRFPMSACISGWSMIHGQSVLIEDIYKDARIPIDAYAPTFVRSLLMVPIRKEDPVGAVGIYWSKQHRASPVVVDLLEMLAQATALALKNITLLNELELRVQERTGELAAALEQVRATGERLRRAETMEALAAMGVGIAHNFNNILQIAISNVSLAQLGGPGARTTGALEATLASLHRATDLTRRVLDFSHQQTDADVVVDLSAVVRDAEPILRPLLGNRTDLRIVTPAKSVFVRGDREHIERVMVLLAENSRDAMPHGGAFTVELAEAGRDKARLSFSDTGHGMDETTRQRAFEPFFSTKGWGSGRATGMGLAVVWGIVQRIGGEVEIDSKPGRGTTVRIDLASQAQ
jgi:two-component system, cell cycle sensor histidine kinase and response regulator CckA